MAVQCQGALGSLDLQHWMLIGAMNRLPEVGRVTPCAPFFALQESVVAAVGAQRTARPTFRFVESEEFRQELRSGLERRTTD